MPSLRIVGRKIIFCVSMLSFFLFVLSSTAEQSHALDKRLHLLFKTSAYGAAAGGVIGLGTFAMGIGDYKNILMGASSGLYAGILLAAYVVVTADIDKPTRKYHGPKRPVGDDDWEEEDNDEDVLKEHVPMNQDDQGMRDLHLRFQVVQNQSLHEMPRGQVWSPILTLEF